LNFSQFRVTRNSDLALDEDDVSNLRTALREELAHRQYGEAMRLEVTQECNDELGQFLLEQFDLPEPALVSCEWASEFGRLIQLPDLAEGAHLKFMLVYPKWPKQGCKKTSPFCANQTAKTC
jgi:polyphosphate kinase